MTLTRHAKVALALLGVIAAMPRMAGAQDEDQLTLFVQSDCMKSTSADYQEIETEIWQPMHQELVNQGKKTSWALYWVLYGDRSDCDYITVNVYRGQQQLNDNTSFADLFAAVHPGQDWDEAVSKTFSSREMVGTELWTLVDGVPPKDYQYIQVNQMNAEDGSDFIRNEVETWKPVHQALVDNGHTAGWGLYALQYPFGTSMEYNYGTVDFLNHLGPVPIAATMREVHPDREFAAITQETEDARDFVYGQVWVLMAGTQQAEDSN